MRPSNMWTAIAVTSLLGAVSAVKADSMYCNDDIVSSGDSVEKVLENCGEPTSRDGYRWIYKVDDSLSKIVTFSNGLVVSITDGDFSGFRNTPFENKP